VLELLGRHPAVGVLGARQVGETTLAHHIAKRFRGPVLRVLIDRSNAGALFLVLGAPRRSCCIL